ncbi:type II toxin-antitoxin system HipA family toxin [Algoriphagus sediminis]|uniref:HipA domain-containing protein n=1 Tax=Algoriphagus sediminis TaxID=3057113 RepID=A0ABT7YB77_9BACT|nr:HipA domain-containing protein [Algoriphagus sediminis]MDN3203780.1 HipA domain-containing protein [Algoriphagus sediminis]
MPNPNHHREILVYADWEGLGGPEPVGVLSSERVRGSEVFSFSYSESWLKNKYAQVIDPDLQLFSGRQYLAEAERQNFGVFTDSSPDRWGRVLMRRREAAVARKEERSPRNLFETDYLLGVYDEHRMGALRFKLSEDGPFLNNDRALASPPWTSIRQLEEISLKLEGDDVMDDPEYLNWLNMLIAPGSSLGGARPKASVQDPDGHLWIAKFPSKNDEGNIGAWEWITYQLALESGINMGPAQARTFSAAHHTFLAKRFDRTAEGGRLHFASAMTMLGYADGDDYHEGVSYLELVEFITTSGANVKQDLAELWRRIVFSMCVSNTDDHLRNHGFMLTTSGWILSPAYDINPVETGTGLKLNVSEDDNALDLDLAMEVIPYFRIKEKEALAIIKEVKNSVRKWSTLAQEMGISRGEIELKANAFRLVE